jgi:hypothetical protein
MPNVAGKGDPNFKTHNVQLRLSDQLANQIGMPFIPSKLFVEDATTFRLDLVRGSRLINQDGHWFSMIPVECEIFLRGDAEAAGPELADANGVALDGEPKPLSGGLISGDGAPGGHFTTKFTLFFPG